MNKVFFIGNITRDPEYTQTAAGISACRFTLAVNRPYADGNGERQADFFNCTAWRGLADTVAKYCKKGHKIAVVGSVQIRTYQGNDGTNKTSVDIIVQEVEFLTQRDRSDDFYDDAPNEKKPRAVQERRQLSFDDDGDIPF